MVTPQTHPIVGHIHAGLALSLHAQAWADRAEERVRRGRSRAFPAGAEVTEYCGAPSAQAKFAAAQVIGQFEALNHLSIICLLDKAAQADGFDVGPYPHTDEQNQYAVDFGFALGLMATGSGSSWFDDHERFDLKTPLVEFHYDLAGKAA